MNDEQTLAPNAAHDEYVVEMTKLVDQQVGTLVILMNLALDRLAPVSPTPTSLNVERRGRTVSVAMDASGKTATFTVVSVSDLPLEEKAAVMAEGQARCVVQSPDGAEEVWVLRRTAIVPTGDGVENSPLYVEQVEDTPVYNWMRERDSAVIDVDVLTETLKTFFI